MGEKLRDMSGAGKPIGPKKDASGNRYLALILIIVAIWLAFQLMTGGIFLSSRNMGTLFLQTSVLGCVTIGAVGVMVTRGIDLSVASVVALIVAVGAILNINYGLSPPVVLLVMFLLSMLVSAFQGFFVAKMAIPAFVVTLAGQLFFRGLSLIITSGSEHAPVDRKISKLASTWIPPLISTCIILGFLAVLALLMFCSNESAKKLGIPSKTLSQFFVSMIPVIFLAALLIYVASFKGLPLLFMIMAVWAIIMHVVLGHTPLGRRIYAVGSNPEAARLTGISPQSIVFFSFLFMGVSYALASVGTMARITGYAPGIATNIELDAIASCVIGGTSLMGGFGTVIGALLGAILLSSVDNGMILMGISSFWQYVVKGLILLLAVIIDVRFKKNK